MMNKEKGKHVFLQVMAQRNQRSYLSNLDLKMFAKESLYVQIKMFFLIPNIFQRLIKMNQKRKSAIYQIYHNIDFIQFFV